MKEGPDIAHLAALIGDPARANILTALMGGHALTATELAEEAGVTLPTTSQHISKLVDAGFLTARKQGRHKYVAIASNEVAEVIEALMGLAETQGFSRVRPGPRDARLREARVCYNHLAGTRGVQMFQSMTGRGFLSITSEGLTLTDAGAMFSKAFGVDVHALQSARSPMCRECLDWSERKSHLAGGLGRALLTKMEGDNWVRRDTGSRAVLFSPKGSKQFEAAFPLY